MKSLIEILKPVAVGSVTIMITGLILYYLNQGKAGATVAQWSQKVTAGYGMGGGGLTQA